MNQGKGVSRAHLARKVRVGRSYVTKLEKGTAQPSAEVMFRVAQYFKQPIEAIFQQTNDGERKDASMPLDAVPVRHIRDPILTPPASPAGTETTKDKSLVNPTAKVVASLSRSKPKAKK
jgi:DNA-binding XRE family transcriptional regulator